ncbi:aminopeptidase N [Catellatospora sp. TT07R-123]|uniref:aminopeptidase N n=1 Tax=Catellatospora sp. TT07R-123 TaxID=2733863 RepID=UPI001BB3E479|nr:aminopeptidase N [Catellatospora sp. TT07R-123]
MRNLSHVEAIDRARLITVAAYDITVDLTDGRGAPADDTFRTITEVAFTCTEPGAETFAQVAARAVRAASLNGRSLDLSGWSADKGLALSDLAAVNTLIVDADYEFSSTGQGLHRLVDPVDAEVYLYSQFQAQDAQRVYACFDQPDLKAVFTWHVTAPAHWRVVSNAVVERVERDQTAQVVHFAESVRMSTYITALCAGPFYEVREMHDGIDLGLLARRSMGQYLEPDDLFATTRQGFDFYHAQFGVRYPLPKYDQLFLPEFNKGAMENFGCVVNAEQTFIFRSPVTDFEYEQRANTLLHEMAHMWFGNLVTMRWWDDLWLSESFAEWASHWCNTEATRFTDAWTTFLSLHKSWAYRQDQLSTTHPVYSRMDDVAAVEVNFDGITYAKGASVLKQIVAYVGIDPFVAALRQYFAKHAWGNTTLSDLLTELAQTSGRDVTPFAAQWLTTAQVNTLHPEIESDAGAYRRVAIRQTAPMDHPTLRRHRIGVGLYDLVGAELVRRQIVHVDIDGPVTELPELIGLRTADVLLLNDDDHSYAKIRLDSRSLATVVDHIAGFGSSLARGLCWAAAWDMVRDGEMASRDYLALVASGLPQETDINLITATLMQARTAIGQYADPEWHAPGWELLATVSRTAMLEAAPASGFQLAWARSFAFAARGEQDLAVLKGWLTGSGVPTGLTVAGDLRWHIIQMLAAAGRVGAAEVAAEHAADHTATGDRQAELALAMLPDGAAKAAVWEALTASQQPPNWKARAMLIGFQHPSQRELLAPYTKRYFDVAARIWAERDSESAQEFMTFAYPRFDISEEAIAYAERWLARDGHPAPLRRLVIEGKDAVARALACRLRDTAARQVAVAGS